MSETNIIEEVRAAKSWVDSQSATLAELGSRLLALGQAYESRTGEYADVPRRQPDWFRKAIETAQDEPGREFINDARSARAN
jgi:hypothetical protein